MIVTTRPAIANLANSFERSGAAVPAALAKALARRTEVVDRFAARPVPAADALPVTILGCLEAGVDPATDPTVQQIITAAHLGGLHSLANDIEGILLDAIRVTAIACTPDVIAAWRPSFTEAARSLAEAHGVLDGIGLDDTTAIVQLGPDAATAWATAQDALGTIDAIVSGWLALYELTTGTTQNKRHRLNVIADVDASVWIDHALDGHPVDPWAAITVGYPLVLPSIDEYRATIAGIEAERSERADAAATQRRGALTGRRARVG